MFKKMIKNFSVRQIVGAALVSLAAFSTATAQTTPKPCFDFTGSGRTSFATANRTESSNIVFRILGNGGTNGGTPQLFLFGLSETDRFAPGYYDNDNRADLGVYRPNSATYFIRPSSGSGSFQSTQFGASTDFSGYEADYDGDGRDDLTVVRDGNGAGGGANLTWFILRSGNNTFSGNNFGLAGFSQNNDTGDIPIAGADYNGDGRADITVIRRNPNGGDTYFAGDAATGALVRVQQWGEFDTDFYVVGDYVGDNRADFAVFRAFSGNTGVNGQWFILENGGSSTIVNRIFGLNSLASPSDRPICGDYNGDGKQDIAVYRSSNSAFYWLNSPAFNSFSGVQFGQPGDTAIAGLRAF